MAEYKYFNFACEDLLSVVTNKKLSSREFYTFFLARLCKMFRYKNLPKTVPRDVLEVNLLTNGITYFTRYNDKYYVFNGSLGGEQDVYYRPTKFIVSSPALSFSKEYTLWKPDLTESDDGVLIRNDSLWHGVHSLLARYASLLAENLLTMRIASVNLRIPYLISAGDDNTYMSAMEFLKKVDKGESGVIMDNALVQGLKLLTPNSNNSYVVQFIELQQYLLGSFYNEIGLNANFNMKRESIVSSEAELNEDSMLPLCDDMLKCRREDICRINELYGLDIEVDFDSAWFENAIVRAESVLAMSSNSSTSELGESFDSSESSDSSPSELVESDYDGELGDSSPSELGDSSTSELEQSSPIQGMLNEAIEEYMEENLCPEDFSASELADNQYSSSEKEGEDDGTSESEG